DGSPWRLHPSGRWMRGAQVLRVSAGDLLGIVADDRFTVPAQPRGGTVRFAKRVHHPGTKAQPWLAKSAELAASRNGFTFRKS
ncbi:hypothetical protein ABEP83_12185, partial [Cutibacterium acnes]